MQLAENEPCLRGIGRSGIFAAPITIVLPEMAMHSKVVVLRPTAKFAVLDLRSERHACVHHAALDVLATPDPTVKAAKSFAAYEAWRRGELTTACPDVAVLSDGARVCKYASQVPDRPARPSNMQVVGMSRVKTGKSKYTIHAVAHAESYAIDLMWDLIARCVSHTCLSLTLHGFDLQKIS